MEMEILTPSHVGWNNFREKMQIFMREKGCQQDLRNAEKVLEKVFSDSVDVEKTIQFFKDFGGYCDCEIFLNVIPNWREELFKMVASKRGKDNLTMKERDNETKLKVFHLLEELVEDIDLRCADALMVEGIVSGDIYTALDRVKWRWLREHIECRAENRFKGTTGKDLLKFDQSVPEAEEKLLKND